MSLLWFVWLQYMLRNVVTQFWETSQLWIRECFHHLGIECPLPQVLGTRNGFSFGCLWTLVYFNKHNEISWGLDPSLNRKFTYVSCTCMCSTEVILDGIEKFCNLEHFRFYIFGPEIFNLCNEMIRTICGLPAAPASPLTSSLLLLLKRSSFGCQVAQCRRPLRMTVLSPLDIQKRRLGKQHLRGIWEYIPGDWGNWTVPRTQGGGTMKSTPGSLLP